MATTITRTATCPFCGQEFDGLTKTEVDTLKEGGCSDIGAECNGGGIAAGDLWSDHRQDVWF